MFILRLLWAAIKASILSALIGGFIFFILAIAQLILGLSDGLVITILVIATGCIFLWLTYDNYQWATFEKYCDAELKVFKKNYKKSLV